jgi:hypothetical protein
MTDDREWLQEQLQPLEDDVPPMPENLHARWAKAVKQEPRAKTPPGTSRVPWKRILASAAAVVFVFGGALWAHSVNLGKEDSAQYVSLGYTYSEDFGSDEETSSSTGTMLMSTAADTTSANSAAESQAQKIIRTVSLSVGSTTFDDTLSTIKQTCTDAGGWISSSTEFGSSTMKSATLIMRIPADALDTFLAGEDSWGRIIRKSETAEDVTDSYYDTKTRLETQQKLLARLQELVAQATDLSDILALESQMADTQYEIDRLTGMLESTDQQVSYATVEIYLQEDTPATVAETREQSLWERMGSALKVGGEAFLSFLGDAAVFVVYALPFVAVAAVVVIVVVKVVKKHRS